VRFVALDVETANPDMSSICQIGIVHFEDGLVVDSWSTLVDPGDYFDGMNVSIHTAFDRNAIARASAKHAIATPECVWLNTASVARRAWPEVAQKGYGLSALSQKFGFEFQHHNAVEDARAAGLVLIKAMEVASLDLNAWIERVRRPINPDANDSVARDGNPDGTLFGEIVVFTGALAIPRREASEMAAKAGCEVADGVTKHTTLLVVGDQDIRILNGHEKSGKHRKAEELIAKGKAIRILTESDFASMVGMS
jgi:DNA polymerase-3 subunit epsilon